MKKLFLLLILLFFPFLVSAQTFERNLYFGLRNDADVTKLQEFLTDEGVYTGPITGNFFSLTLKAVKDFQTRESITPAAGYFGPITRAKANETLTAQIGASNEQAIAETGSLPTQPETPKTTNDVVNSLQGQIALLLQQITLLQQQLTAQQTTQQEVAAVKEQVIQQTQTIQQQTQTIQQQNETIQQIQQQTVPVVPPAPIVYVPPEPKILSFTGEYGSISWTTENISECNLYFGGDGAGRKYPFQTLHTQFAGGVWIPGSTLRPNGTMGRGASGWGDYFPKGTTDLILECSGQGKTITQSLPIIKP